MRFPTLDQWLTWQETLHPREIDLGLERVQEVLGRMAVERPAPCVVTVAGTNGKGTSVALLEAMLRAAGLRVGAYTSPHLLRYNERIRIDGRPVSDDSLCQAFARVDQARGDVSLSYFEFGTLAAFDLFARAALDVALLEVGMGGRLDAVNVVAADIALVTALDVDHVRWLGSDREAIGHEKAGIFRSGRAAVVSDPQPPNSLLVHARQFQVPLSRLGHEYHYWPQPPFTDAPATWSWRSAGRCYEALPLPAIAGSWQLQNAAGVLMVMERLEAFFPLGRQVIEAGLQQVHLSGRFQCFPAAVPCIVDVAHNRQAALVLARELRQQPVAGRTHGVCAMLADKDALAVYRAMAPAVDVWHLADLTVARGAAAASLAASLDDATEGAPCTCYDTVTGAYEGAMAAAVAGDRIVIFGSFHTAAAVLPFLEARSAP
ncbi:MAG: bifunctional tetrahydrofolate synthase/dihydrofolate synthase [Gammaproteobacteria bacterium]